MRGRDLLNGWLGWRVDGEKNPYKIVKRRSLFCFFVCFFGGGRRRREGGGRGGIHESKYRIIMLRLRKKNRKKTRLKRWCSMKILRVQYLIALGRTNFAVDYSFDHHHHQMWVV